MLWTATSFTDVGVVGVGVGSAAAADALAQERLAVVEVEKGLAMGVVVLSLKNFSVVAKCRL